MESFIKEPNKEEIPDIPNDPYKALGVSRNASPEEIKRAYKELAHKYHPDVNTRNEKIAEWFIAVTDARNLLLEPEKNAGRSHYFKIHSQESGNIFGDILKRAEEKRAEEMARRKTEDFQPKQRENEEQERKVKEKKTAEIVKLINDLTALRSKYSDISVNVLCKEYEDADAQIGAVDVEIKNVISQLAEKSGQPAEEIKNDFYRKTNEILKKRKEDRLNFLKSRLDTKIRDLHFIIDRLEQDLEMSKENTPSYKVGVGKMIERFFMPSTPTFSRGTELLIDKIRKQLKERQEEMKITVQKLKEIENALSYIN